MLPDRACSNRNAVEDAAPSLDALARTAGEGFDLCIAPGLTTLEGVPGKAITEHYGLVQGSTIRAKHVGKDILAGFKNIVGGEMKAYTELLQEAREEAVARMVAQAEAIGANAVVNVRFSTSSVTAGAAELFAYGTAVVLEGA